MSHPYIPYVTLDGEEVRLDNVEFLNIEEDINGRDLVTFNYEGERHQAYVIHKPYYMELISSKLEYTSTVRTRKKGRINK